MKAGAEHPFQSYQAVKEDTRSDALAEAIPLDRTHQMYSGHALIEM